MFDLHLALYIVSTFVFPVERSSREWVCVCYKVQVDVWPKEGFFYLFLSRLLSLKAQKCQLKS